MTTPQAVFFGVLFLAGGWFGGLTGYVFLSDRRRQRRPSQARHRAEAPNGKP